MNNSFLEKINFPYEDLRIGQEKFLKKVYDAIESEENLLVQAPTGLGKSISALAPAISFAKKNDLAVICITSRQTQTNQLIKTIKDISKKYKEKNNQDINLATFTGKRNMCAHSEKENYSGNEFNDFCKGMKERGKCSFYKNFKNTDYEEIIKRLLKKTEKEYLNVENFINLVSSPINTGSEIISGFCPYEIALKKAYKADVVVCDFNYLFMPNILNTFLGRIGRNLDECILIIDEAHNLPDRIRNSHSYKLSTERIRLAEKEMKNFLKKSDFDNIIRAIHDTYDQIYVDFLMGDKNEFLLKKELFFDILKDKLRKYYGDKYLDIRKLILELEEIEMIIKETKVISYVGNVATFLTNFIDIDEKQYVSIINKKINADKTILNIEVKLLDPEIIASKIINSTFSSILMSATLSPTEMYAKLLGIKRTNFLELDSPFEKKNQLSIVIDDVTTKYSLRNNNMYNKYANHIENCLYAAENKNTICFFPSYDLMHKILSFINLPKLNRKILIEKRNMNKEEKEKYISEFKSFSSKSICLFAVTSGSFSEGVDLPSNSLEQVIIVGLPLLVPNIFTNSLIKYYDYKFKKGQLYGYIYPAMNKIIQAAGRCIRTEKDKGVIIFMDNRFLYPIYNLAFPKYYHLKKADKDYITEIKEFFEN
jgi:DNA excision repair protein ERCC-2